MDPFKIILVPSLPAEGSLSMQIYWHAVESALRKEIASAGIPAEIQICLPDRRPSVGKGEKQWLRYAAHPRLLRSMLRASPPRTAVHILDHSAAHLTTRTVPCVVTCHDLTHDEQRSLGFFQHHLWHWRINGMHRARTIFSVSAYLGNQIVQRLGIESSRVCVNPNGLSPLFRPLPQDHAFTPEFRRLRDRHASEFFILNVGTNQPRKNLPALLQAVALLREKGESVRLLKAGEPLAGSEHAPLLRSLGLQEAVTDLGIMPQAKLVELYNLCNVLSFPTKVEGFGWPTVEAQACGLPAVLSDIACLKEVGGEAALYHHPDKPEDLALQLQRIRKDATLRNQIVTLGYKNAALYTWESHARRLLQVYASAVADLPHSPAGLAEPRAA